MDPGPAGRGDRPRPPTLLGDFQFGKAAEGLYHFAWDEVCDWYLELAKVQMPATGGDPAGSPPPRQVLGTVLDALLRLLHPFVPFVTETLWTALTGGEIAGDRRLADAVRSAARIRPRAGWVADVDKLVTEIRRFRADQGLPADQAGPGALDRSAATVTGRSLLLATAAVLTRLEPADESASPTTALAPGRAGRRGHRDGRSWTPRPRSMSRPRSPAPARISRSPRRRSRTPAKKLGNPAFLGKAPGRGRRQDPGTGGAGAPPTSTRLTERLAALARAAGT